MTYAYKSPDFETNVIRRLGDLEQRIIDLIHPIQQTAKLIQSPDLQVLMVDLRKSTAAFEKLLDQLINKTREHCQQLTESFQAIDIGQAFLEIKYIGNRLKQIEAQLKEINEDGINRQIRCKIEVEGFSQDVEIKKEKRNIKIQDCDLSYRSKNLCLIGDIRTLRDLCAYNRHELRQFRSVGRKTIQELEDLLNKHGLNFKN